MGDVKKETSRQTNAELVVQLRSIVDRQGEVAVVLVQRELFNRAIGRIAETLRRPDTRMEDAALVDAGIDPPQSPNPEHVEGDVSVGELVRKLNHLVSLNEPKNGGPFQGFAAQACVEAMREAASRLSQAGVRDEDVERVAIAMHDTRKAEAGWWAPWTEIPEDYRRKSLAMVRAGLAALSGDTL